MVDDLSANLEHCVSSSWQLLHQHGHHVKSAAEQTSRQEGGLIVTHQVAKEPDEGKLSRLVLQIIGGTTPADELTLEEESNRFWLNPN